MLELLILKAKNHVHYKNLEIDFTKLKDNLIFITGQNFDTAGSKSNGSGKSVIGDLLTDLLFDKTIRRHSPKSFIGKFAKWSYSSILLRNSLNKDLYSIKKYRNHPSKKDKVLFFRKSSGGKKKDLSKKRKKDTYKTISEELDLNWETFKNRNYYGQKDNKRFLNVTDSEKAKIIVDIKNLGDLQECKRISHDSFKEAEKILLVVETEILTLEESLKLLESSLVSLYENTKKSIKDLKNRLEDLNETKEGILKKLSYAKKNIKGIEELRNKFKSLKQDIEEIDKIVRKYSEQEKILLDIQSLQKKEAREKREMSAKILADKNKRKDVKTQVITKCPECGARLIEKRRKKTLLVINKRIKNSKKKILQLEKRVKPSILKVSNQKKVLKNLSKKREKFLPTIRKREIILKKIRKKEKWEAIFPLFEKEIDEIDEEINRIEEVVKNPSERTVIISFLKKKKDVKEKIKEAVKRREKFFSKKEKSFFAEKTFEKTIRVLFDEFLNNLNYFSNLYLGVMSDNDIEVIFSPKAERASKKVVDEINAIVKVNSDSPRPFRTYSGGETGKIEFSTQIALFSSADSPFSLLFLDEPFVGMDPGGIDRAIELLKQKADEGNRVLVISHESVVGGFGSNINVIRKDGESHLEFN